MGGFGQFIRTSTCSVCRGQGSIVNDPCETCRGTGRLGRHAPSRSTCPPASRDGQTLIVRGAGRRRGAGRPAGRPARARRRRAARALRARRRRPHLPPGHHHDRGGRSARPSTCRRWTATSSSPLAAGTQPGEVKVFRNRGVPVLQGYGRGDLKIVVNVLVPRHLTDEQRELLEQFARARRRQELRARPELPGQGPGRLPPVTGRRGTRATRCGWRRQRRRPAAPRSTRERRAFPAACRSTTGRAPVPPAPDPAALEYLHPERRGPAARARRRLAGAGRRRHARVLAAGGRRARARRGAARSTGWARLGRLDAADEPPGWEDGWKALPPAAGRSAASTCGRRGTPPRDGPARRGRSTPAWPSAPAATHDAPVPRGAPAHRRPVAPRPRLRQRRGVAGGAAPRVRAGRGASTSTPWPCRRPADNAARNGLSPVLHRGRRHGSRACRCPAADDRGRQHRPRRPSCASRALRRVNGRRPRAPPRSCCSPACL